MSKVHKGRVGAASSLAYLPNNLPLIEILNISCLIPTGKGSSNPLLDRGLFGHLSEHKGTRHWKKCVCVVISLTVEQPLNKCIVNEVIKGIAKRIHLQARSCKNRLGGD